MKQYKLNLKSTLAAIVIATGVTFALPAIADVKSDTKSDVATQEVKGKPQTHCPVMGSPINRNNFYDYKGKRIYYCCYGCINLISKDPEKYIKQLEDQGIVLDKTPK